MRFIDGDGLCFHETRRASCSTQICMYIEVLYIILSLLIQLIDIKVIVCVIRRMKVELFEMLRYTFLRTATHVATLYNHYLVNT